MRGNRLKAVAGNQCGVDRRERTVRALAGSLQPGL